MRANWIINKSCFSLDLDLSFNIEIRWFYEQKRSRVSGLNKSDEFSLCTYLVKKTSERKKYIFYDFAVIPSCQVWKWIYYAFLPKLTPYILLPFYPDTRNSKYAPSSVFRGHNSGKGLKEASILEKKSCYPKAQIHWSTSICCQYTHENGKDIDFGLQKP